MNITPRRVRRRALHLTAGAGLLTVLVMLDWWEHWLLPADRPYLALMVYALFLGVALAGGITAAAASCHVAVARAFSAGVRTGMRYMDDSPTRREPLRLVE